MLERGPERSKAGGKTRFPPSVTMRWNTYRGLTQRENVETLTFRHKPDERRCRMRLTGFLPRVRRRRSDSHWNGQTWRFQTTDYTLATHLRQRYGKKGIPEGMTVQDWGITYDDLEQYYMFETIFAVSGKAGNIRASSGRRAILRNRTAGAPNVLPPLEVTESATCSAKRLAPRLQPVPDALLNASRAAPNIEGLSLGACQYCGHCEPSGARPMPRRGRDVCSCRCCAKNEVRDAAES